MFGGKDKPLSEESAKKLEEILDWLYEHQHEFMIDTGVCPLCGTDTMECMENGIHEMVINKDNFLLKLERGDYGRICNFFYRKETMENKNRDWIEGWYIIDEDDETWRIVTDEDPRYERVVTPRAIWGRLKVEKKCHFCGEAEKPGTILNDRWFCDECKQESGTVVL